MIHYIKNIYQSVLSNQIRHLELFCFLDQFCSRHFLTIGQMDIFRNPHFQLKTKPQSEYEPNLIPNLHNYIVQLLRIHFRRHHINHGERRFFPIAEKHHKTATFESEFDFAVSSATFYVFLILCTFSSKKSKATFLCRKFPANTELNVAILSWTRIGDSTVIVSYKSLQFYDLCIVYFYNFCIVSMFYLLF